MDVSGIVDTFFVRFYFILPFLLRNQIISLLFIRKCNRYERIRNIRVGRVNLYIVWGKMYKHNTWIHLDNWLIYGMFMLNEKRERERERWIGLDEIYKSSPKTFFTVIFLTLSSAAGREAQQLFRSECARELNKAMRSTFHSIIRLDWTYCFLGTRGKFSIFPYLLRVSERVVRQLVWVGVWCVYEEAKHTRVPGGNVLNVYEH